VEIRAEAKEPAGRSFRSQSQKLISSTVTKRRAEALKRDNMVDKILFLGEEEEEEPEVV
jgi:hypothetical protein